MKFVKLFYDKYYSWWKNVDKFIFSLIILLFTIGLFISLVSTSLIASDKLETNDYLFFFKHLFFVFLGMFVIFVISSIDQEKIFKYSFFIFLISLFFLFLVPLIGLEVKGSKRWIDLFLLPRFQPIELVKPFFIVVIGLIMSNEKFSNLYLKYLFSFFLTIIVGLLLIVQPDIGQTLLIFFSWLVLIFTSGINLVLLIICLFFSLIIISYLVFFIPKFAYIKNRLISFFDTETGTHNFQSDKAIESITSGGFFGKGIGEGTLKSRVPEAHTDYIISVISEEFGIISIILLLILFLTFIRAVLKKIYLENDEKIRLILTGCISLILMQVIVHVGVNIRLLPTTGMTMPYLSYGGSSIISISIISGIILNLTKRKFL
tara:strand:- start:258 stop:1382 length:1125 start_codon:yes stop_codon:yes gene_type:complete